MDIKLKDLLWFIGTDQSIKLEHSSGEEFYPSYMDLEQYKEFYVVNISCDTDRVMVISIREEV